jgi:hypothetical protein
MILGHYSSYANLLLACQLFDCLTGKAESAQPVIKTEDIPRDDIISQRTSKRKLSEYSDIGVENDRVVLGRFYELSADPLRYGNGRMVKSLPGTTSLIALRTDKDPIVDCVFLSLDFEISEHMPVIMRVRRVAGVEDVHLDDVALLHSGLNVGMIDIDSVQYDSARKCIVHSGNNIRGKHMVSSNEETTIFLGDIPVLLVQRVAGEQNLALYPLRGGFFAVRPDGNEMPDIVSLGEAGFLYLSLNSPQEESRVRIPLARWMSVNEKIVFRKTISCPIRQEGISKR